MVGPGKATVTVDSLVMSARVWGETVLEAQRAPMTLIQFSHGIERQRSKTFSALTGGDEATYCALGIKINESLMASAFPDRAAVICAPRSSTVLAQFNDTLNYLAAKCPDDRFGNRISVLQGSWFVITHMLGGETGSAHAPAVDLCHHVSSCFSFWGRHRLIRLSYSYNYFCPAPFLMPLPVSPSCSPSPCRAGAVNPRGRDAALPISCHAPHGSWQLSPTQYNFPNQTEELNEISPCYLSGRIGRSSVPPWWTDNATHLLFFFFIIGMPPLASRQNVLVLAKSGSVSALPSKLFRRHV